MYQSTEYEFGRHFVPKYWAAILFIETNFANTDVGSRNCKRYQLHKSVEVLCMSRRYLGRRGTISPVLASSESE